ncbi:hypothetical protein ruthe_00499 [Rubellimicrobium thermophilum DSM 16684]|uniref:Secreted protein n=1 Tax=Rubellimicrobium thermophilum DSM 16684 TaxID=1123069 RepID=S9SLX8_9RHOB|nr:hypothetical protein [Rubellimicrobium thermophilum]EPX87429.1 hypothetical protein ruthe_00499 [Rubellimicrobium thermophilum DSM 16684]
MLRIVLLLIASALPVAAQDPEPLGAAEFEILVEGRTLTYGMQGTEPYGIEHYHPDRRVTWAWAGSTECLSGRWYEEGPSDDPAICFVYDDDPSSPQCWQVYQEGERLRAVFLGGDESVLYEIGEAPDGLVCGGVGA